MSRSLRCRALALALAAIFPLASAGTLVAGHGCPHHDALGSDAGLGHHAGAAMAEAGASGSGAAVEHAGSPGNSDEHSTFCTCVGDCHAGSAVPHLATPAAPRLASSARSATCPWTRSEHLPGTVPYLLPFANAPPTV